MKTFFDRSAFGIALFILYKGAMAQQIDCNGLSDVLSEMVTLDQQIRQESILLEQNRKSTNVERDALQQRWSAIDAKNLKQFKEIIAVCGWPKTSKDSHNAWLLAQHADSDVSFQRYVKGLLENAVRAGTGAARDLAYLADRIATNENRPQEYGTQLSFPTRCQIEPFPVDDLQLVKQRRLAIGLQSLEEYIAEGRKRLLPADCPSETSLKDN